MGIFQLVAFDLDDTLYPEREFVHSGFTAVAQHLADLGVIDAESFFNAATSLFIAGARGNIFNLALERLAIVFPAASVNELVRVYREHQPQIRPFAGSPTLLQLLKAKGVVSGLDFRRSGRNAAEQAPRFGTGSLFRSSGVYRSPWRGLGQAQPQSFSGGNGGQRRPGRGLRLCGG